MAPQNFPVVCVFGEVSSLDKLKFQEDLSIHFFRSDKDLDRLIRQYKPNVFISIGKSWEQFPKLIASPYIVRSRWLHFNSFDEVTLDTIYNCCMSSINKSSDENNPLMSVITTAYKSGDKIQRPFKSLLKQTYPNWEWIIFDDNQQPDTQLDQLATKDHRIRVYRSTGNSGIIGEVKYNASMLARGQYIIEVDHDDELTPYALDHIRRAFKDHPEAGFAYSDFAEPEEENYTPAIYGDGWAMGWGSYRIGRYTNVKGDTFNAHIAQTACITPMTMTNIVGVPNHVRVWRADLYRQIGGNNYNLPVADDYELLIRTFLKTKFIRIRDLCYIQYRNSPQNGGNTTFNWNSLIQKCQSLVSHYYQQQLDNHFLNKLQVAPQDLQAEKNTVCPIWLRGWDFNPLRVARQIDWSPTSKDCISIILPTYKRPQLLKRAIDSVLAQSYTDWELFIVGDECPDLNSVMEDPKYHDRRIFWWNIQTRSNDLGTTPRNYALHTMVRSSLVAYLDDDNYWSPDHLEHLKQALDAYPDAQFAFSSFAMIQEPGTVTTPVICKKPRLYRVDTSALLHRYDLVHRHGYWKTGYGHDFELVSRWLHYKWVATQRVTVFYRVHGQVDVQRLATFYDKEPLDPAELQTDRYGFIVGPVATTSDTK